jgi:hypothetical protein
MCNIFGMFYLKYWITLLEEISEEERNALSKKSMVQM